MFQFLSDSGDIFHGYFIGRFRQRNSIRNFIGLAVPSNDIRDRRLMFQKDTPVSTIIRKGSTKLENLLYLHGVYAARVPTEKRAIRYIQSYKISLLSMHSNAQSHTFAKTAGSRTVIIRRSWGQFSAHKNEHNSPLFLAKFPKAPAALARVFSSASCSPEHRKGMAYDSRG